MSNLIRLTADDHFFVHLLLARIHKDTPNAWRLYSALQVMCEVIHGRKNKKKNVVINAPRARRLYKATKEFASFQLRSKEELHFVHYTGIERCYTIYDLCKEFDLDRSMLVVNMYTNCLSSTEKKNIRIGI